MQKYLLLAVALLTTAVTFAQKKFTYNDLSDGLFASKTVRGVRSMNDGIHYTTQEGSAIVKYSYETGEAVDTIVNTKNTTPALNFSDYEFSSDERKILLTVDPQAIYRHSFTADYWIYDIAGNSLKKLSDNGRQQVAQLSPDGQKAAFVRDNNLFWVDLNSGKEVQVTTDGKRNEILNGIPDWVYEEEYSFSRAYEWSPQSDYIAYYRTDETNVKEYNMNFFEDSLYPTVYKFKYPKAGEENSTVTIHVYNLANGSTRQMETQTGGEHYIPRIVWTANPGKLAVFRINREQNHFELLYADAKSGEAQVIYNEANPRYVERIDYETVTFLPDGDRFIIKSEKNGYMHLYLYSIRKGALNRITDGAWEVVSLLGVDDKAGKLYYTSTETSPLKRNLYSIRLNGKDKKRITTGEGTYTINFSKGFKYFISYFSNISTPNTVTLHTADGKAVRVLEDNATLKARIAEYGLPQKEFFTFTTSEGVSLYGWMIKPPHFDNTKKYPLLMTQYSGPGSQRVSDSWKTDWEDALAQEGFVIACVDGRGTGFRGEEFKKCTYKDLGNLEVKDQIEAAKYLGSLQFIDPERIAIYGWSYGGFMALNCILKGNDVFHAAVSVAPVTSWRFYDTIYTELYNGNPNDNPEGYDNNSPINYAELLKGKLFLAHGTGDDNVHIQNTYRMVKALNEADKEYELHIYPDRNHSMGPDRKHLINAAIEFLIRTIGDNGGNE
ncbi:MAG TPA: S9 family peptidase [Candidatus Avirikenella pullistercoris]|nr:S9 family peptidase [Candidatus Avirikenella pullistercoris]